MGREHRKRALPDRETIRSREGVDIIAQRIDRMLGLLEKFSG